MAWQKIMKFGPFMFYNGDDISGGWLFLFQVGRFALRIGLDQKLVMAQPAYSGVFRKKKR